MANGELQGRRSNVLGRQALCTKGCDLRTAESAAVLEKPFDYRNSI